MTFPERNKNDKAVKSFFHQDLLPLAGEIKSKGKVFFPVEPDPGAATYYTRRKNRVVSPEDFILTGCESWEALQVALADMWREQGYPELARAAAPLASLARDLRETEEETEAVSPFIYVMF